MARLANHSVAYKASSLTTCSCTAVKIRSVAQEIENNETKIGCESQSLLGALCGIILVYQLLTGSQAI